MSDHETDSEESYQTDDSDIKFIPGYIMECPDLGSSDDGSSIEEDNAGLAYADEPLADDKCYCGNCDITLLTNNSECHCCFELEGCEEAMNCKDVIQDLKAEGMQNAKCVTQHPGFNTVCLQKWSLKMAADRYKTKYSQTSTENRLDNLFNYVVKFFFVAKVFPLDLFIK
ncbi:Hypothetical predicted protein [Paramuricea clavata]|uniref:Uncharacterized protein n=1 Tax=Paramuricea clavata TaxID=317549 RepID=A0A6S7ICN1_PARCT|nr:Hypothetical predicted protein [Paramuricea clavata]